MLASMSSPQPISATEFDELVKSYLPSVYRYLLTMLRQKEAAEDMAQEAFMRAWQHIGSYDTSKPFKPWILRIARNCALDSLRKKQLLSISLLDRQEQNTLEQIPDISPIPHEAAVTNETKEDIKTALQSLKYDYQEILTLHYLEDLTVPDIAQMLEIPLETARTRLRRGRAALREILQGAPEPASSAPSVVGVHGQTATPNLTLSSS